MSMNEEKGAVSPIKLLKYAFPIMLTSLLQMFYSIADSIIVGNHVSKEALAAVGSSAPIKNLFVTLFIGISAGSSLVYAKYKGAHDDNTQKVASTSFLFSVVSGLFMSVIGLIFTKEILGLMDVDKEIFDLSNQYLTIYFYGLLFEVVYSFLSALVRADGDSKSPLYIIIGTSILNVILNVIFVVKLNMGVAGVGWTTTISNFLNAILILIVAIKKKMIVINQLDYDSKILKEVLTKGIPSGIQSSVFSIANTIIQKSINGFGTNMMAAFTASGYIETCLYYIINAFHISAMVYVSYYRGSGETDNIKKVIRYCFQYVSILSIILGVSVTVLGELLVGTFNKTPEVIQLGKLRLMFCELPYLIWGLLDLTLGILKGLGKTTETMIISIVCICGFRIVWIYTIFAHFKSVASLFLIFPCSWLFTLLIAGTWLTYLYKKLKNRNN